MSASISYGTTNIAYSVEYRDRKTLAIEVHPDSSVLVVAPINTTDEKIQSKVEKRASWIAKQQRFFSGKPDIAQVKEWVSGENMYYLGRQYRLKVVLGKPDVKLKGKYLLVSVPNKKNRRQIETLVNAWYLQHARIKFEERIKRFDHILRQEGLQMNSLIIRKLEKRWGSCTPKGNIVINSDLIKAPIHCVDYVIVHELCHLKFHHHGPEFWNLLNKYCPDWVGLKERLENFGI
ncbi:M48 family metallopeptidase [Crocinitomix algicola]|uniref:M48 family metallopeptidase n=1 Tax=Crocinitomix algicola TaxID=1740263 RepID=UPI0008730962|nr:SprT family zinc-dependent metalloprotease [Crocinitomix algicola]